MPDTNINIRTDSELSAKAQAVLADLGIDMTTAINLFLTQIVYKEALPFKIDKPETVNGKIPRSEAMGILKGQVWMADDFDAPLEEMREYME